MEGKREGVCINMRTILVTISCTRDRVPRFLSIHDNLLRGEGRERQTGSEAIKIMHNFRCLRNINSYSFQLAPFTLLELLWVHASMPKNANVREGERGMEREEQQGKFWLSPMHKVVINKRLTKFMRDIEQYLHGIINICIISSIRRAKTYCEYPQMG